MPETTKGRVAALKALEQRRANKPEKVNNASLPAGSPMYFYCISCDWEAAVLPEGYVSRPPKLCAECKAMSELGWLE